MTQYYIIEHDRTKAIMPATFARGSTHWEPKYEGPGLKRPPRLFANRGAARSCIAWWLKGHAHTEIANYSSGFSSIADECDSRIVSTQPIVSRSGEAFNVLPVTLTLGHKL